MQNRDAVINAVLENRIIVIVRGIYGEELVNTVCAMEKGGIRLVELTFDRTSAVPDSTVAENIKALRTYFGDRMHIGSGTVSTVEQLRLAYAAGAEFIISPDSCEEIIRETRSLGLVSIPGAFTPTECANAVRWGADFIKLFPGFCLSPEYVKAIKTPLADVKFLAVAGITPENIRSYMDAGVCGVGVSGGIVCIPEIRAGVFEKITARAEKYCALVKEN